MSFEIGLILLLILANGFFAMSEIAIVSARKARLQQMWNEGDTRAGRALELASDPNKFLSTTQIGITVVGTLAAAFGGATIADKLAVHLRVFPWLEPYAGPVSMAIVVGGISYFSLVLGELAPKRIGLNNPERIASRVAGFMRWLSRAASPAVRLLAWSSGLLMKLFRFREAAESPVTPEEIKVLIEQGTQAGTFHETEQEMMEGVLRLANRRVTELMTPRFRIVWLDIEAPLDENLRKVVENPHSRFPVGRGSLNRPIGILLARDLLPFHLHRSSDRIEDVLQKPLLVPETTRALVLLERFRETSKQVALVVDEHGSVEGLITLADLMMTVVGEADGEEDSTENAGEWQLDGMLPISDFKEMIALRDELPGEGEGTYHTLGGFVMMYLERIPQPGDTFEFAGIRFDVLKMDGRRVDQVGVRRVSKSAESSSDS